MATAAQADDAAQVVELPGDVFGGTPNTATETVVLPESRCFPRAVPSATMAQAVGLIL
jgi:hypothetical protein